MLHGMFQPLVTCHLAWSITITACSPNGMIAANWLRTGRISAVFSSGNTRANAAPASSPVSLKGRR